MTVSRAEINRQKRQDKAMLRTCRQLRKLTVVPSGYRNSYHSDRLRDVFVRFGRFYATNDYVLACVEWPEYEHVGDDDWQVLKSFEVNGELIPFTFEPMEQPFSDNNIFERNFIGKLSHIDPLPVDAKLLASVLKLFEINGISPIIERDEVRYELTGHNKDISIRAVVMGKKR